MKIAGPPVVHPTRSWRAGTGVDGMEASGSALKSFRLALGAMFVSAKYAASCTR